MAAVAFKTDMEKVLQPSGTSGSSLDAIVPGVAPSPARTSPGMEKVLQPGHASMTEFPPLSGGVRVLWERLCRGQRNLLLAPQ